ncbi:MAG: group III truncated hemoglobin [Verrucomicrobiota bacterium]|nr:group III truncated hemoglobin [Verrucomicrobiota bacterium]
MEITGQNSLYDRIGGKDGVMRLLNDFYGRVKLDPVLGPVFASRIENWEEHLEKIHRFWSFQTGGPDVYEGGMGRHVGLPVDTHHFDKWIDEWTISCRKILAPEEAGQMVMVALRFRKILEQMIEMNRRAI